MPGTTVLSDAAGQQNYLGAAAVALKKDVHILISQQVSIASMEHCPVKSSNTPDPSESATHFCLCHPDPKIPRPRNAFILYRQHYQAAVAAQNPGLASFEISKIIGEQWRGLPQETKDEWKALAEEEKARHRQQYPEYRFQPRRYNRDGNLRSGASGISHNPPGSTLCNRCGGRLLNPPVSPEIPYTARASLLGAKPASGEDFAARSSQFQAAEDLDCAPNVTNLVLSRSRQSRLLRQQFAQSRSRSPDSKRRRVRLPRPYDVRERSPHSSFPTSPYTPRSAAADSRSLCQPLQHSSPGRNVKEYTPPDPSLKLTRLQTAAHVSRTNTPTTPYSHGTSIEATVMTIPFLDKIKMLAKISPPLTPAYHDGYSVRRGVVIAVDGQDPVLVKTLIGFLNNTLRKDGRYHTRVFDGPEIQSRESYSDSEQKADAIAGYLNIIISWHRISSEIVSFVKPSWASSEPRSVEEESTSGVSPRTIIPKPAELQINSLEQSSNNNSMSTGPSGPGLITVSVPVALIPQYQLTTTDAFACSVQSRDSYAPLDHWEWMASLWRALVGPDVTVYIRECRKEELERHGANPVEIRLHDARTIVSNRIETVGGNMPGGELKR
ncbi:transcriptional regulator family: HMG [Aspergillus niger]|nr:transcriptional regulator family: HMG [Aspergillus niger]